MLVKRMIKAIFSCLQVIFEKVLTNVKRLLYNITVRKHPAHLRITKGWFNVTRMIKRITAVILSLIMLAGLLPVGALAASVDPASTGAELVSLTVYGITTGSFPVKSIGTEPVKITVDSRNNPVYWFVKGTRVNTIMFTEPNIYGNVWLRNYLIADDSSTIVTDRNLPYREYYRTTGVSSLTMDQNYHLYQVWAKGVAHDEGGDIDEYNHISFEYNGSQAEIHFPHQDNKEVFWDFNQMAPYEPVDFAVYGKSGYYVEDIMYLAKNYKTGEYLKAFGEGISFASLDSALETPKLDTVSTASDGGRYRFWVNGPNNYQTEVIRIITKPYRKLSVSTDSSLVSYKTDKTLSKLKEGEKATVTFSWQDAYVLDSCTLSGKGSLKIVSQTSTSLKAEITAGDGDGKVSLSVKGDPNKFFGVAAECTCDDELAEYVADIEKVKKLTLSGSSVPAGTEVTVTPSSECYAKATSIVVTSNTPGKTFQQDITATRKFTMPNFAVKVTANYGINRSGGYYTADINEIKASGNESTAGFYSSGALSGANSGKQYNYSDGASKRIVKGGERIDVKLNAVDGPNGEKYAYRLKVRDKSSPYGGNVYGTAYFDALNTDMTVDVTIDEGHSVKVSNDTNEIFYVTEGSREMPLWLSQPNRIFLPAGTPVFVEEDTAWIDRMFPKQGEDYEITIRLGSGKEVVEENIRDNFDIGGDKYKAYFSMPDKDVTVHLTQLFYMPMNLNIIGSGSAALERMQDGEWVAADKVLEGDAVRINCEPAAGYRVKSIRYNWNSTNPYAISDFVRSIAFRTPFDEEMASGEPFNIPRTYAGMAFRTAYRRLYVDVEFERDPSVHLHELQKVEAKEPSCTEAGNIEHWICVSDILPCGKVFADENGVNELTLSEVTIDPLGHDWDEWTVTKPASADEEGEETHVCKRCRETETRSIGYLHTVEWLNGDGSVLDTAAYLLRDPEPVTRKRPEKAADAEYNYAFEKWDEGSVDGLVKTYRPLFEQTEKTVYTVFVGSGTADPKHAKAGKLITLTPDEPLQGMCFTGWRVLSGDVTIENNTFIMPESHVEVYATYSVKRYADLGLDLSGEKGYAGKPFTVSGELTENGELLNVSGDVTVTFSSGQPEAEGAVSYTVPIVNGRYRCEAPALTSGNEYIWVSWQGDSEHIEALVMNKIRIYDISVASVYVAIGNGNVKQFYQTGEALDTGNLFIWIYWMDGSEEEIPVTPDMVSGFDSSQPDEPILTVACPYPYNGEITYEVWIKEKDPEEPDEIMMGDVDGDGKVTINDATEIQKILADFYTPTRRQSLAADTDGDGSLTINDATMVQKYLADIIDKLG